MHLQGIWNPFTAPIWYSDYTTNINTEMNYFPALPKVWGKGSFRNLVTPLGTVSCEWENGNLLRYSVKSKKEGVCVFFVDKKL